MIKVSGTVRVLSTFVDSHSGREDVAVAQGELIGIDDDGKFVCVVTNDGAAEVQRFDRVWGEIVIDGRVIGGGE